MAKKPPPKTGHSEAVSKKPQSHALVKEKASKSLSDRTATAVQEPRSQNTALPSNLVSQLFDTDEEEITGAAAVQLLSDHLTQLKESDKEWEEVSRKDREKLWKLLIESFRKHVYSPYDDLTSLKFVLVNIDPEIFHKEMFAEGEKKEFSEALREFENLVRNILQRNPKDAYGHIVLGQILAIRERWNDAEAEFGAALKIDSTNGDVLYELGRLLYGFGNELDGVRTLVNAKQEEVAGKSIFDLIRDFENRPRTEAERAEAKRRYDHALDLSKENHHSAAMHSLRGALQFDPNVGDPDVIQKLLAKGKEEFFSEAENKYRKLIESDPNNAVAHFELGKVLTIQDRLDEAEAEQRKAISIDPKYAMAYYELARLSTQRDAIADAIRALISAEQIDPHIGYPPVGALLAEIKMHLGKNSLEPAQLDLELLDLQSGVREVLRRAVDSRMFEDYLKTAGQTYIAAESKTARDDPSSALLDLSLLGAKRPQRGDMDTRGTESAADAKWTSDHQKKLDELNAIGRKAILNGEDPAALIAAARSAKLAATEITESRLPQPTESQLAVEMMAEKFRRSAAGRVYKFIERNADLAAKGELSQALIAQKLKMQSQNVNKAIKELVQKGLIVRKDAHRGEVKKKKKAYQLTPAPN
ncbi:MAG: tetratricopeptide repeat protein [Rhodospirillaceae bacterium]|nr:MAG: tetratricopeptide repeat protein [Rhodospirillaceae bacterium]